MDKIYKHGSPYFLHRHHLFKHDLTISNHIKPYQTISNHQKAMETDLGLGRNRNPFVLPSNFREDSQDPRIPSRRRRRRLSVAPGFLQGLAAQRQLAAQGLRLGFQQSQLGLLHGLPSEILVKMFVKFVKMCSCQFFKMCSLTSLMFQLRTDGENDEKMMRQ